MIRKREEEISALEQNTADSEVEINEPQKSKKIVIKKQNPNNQ